MAFFLVFHLVGIFSGSGKCIEFHQKKDAGGRTLKSFEEKRTVLYALMASERQQISPSHRNPCMYGFIDKMVKLARALRKRHTGIYSERIVLRCQQLR